MALVLLIALVVAGKVSVRLGLAIFAIGFALEMIVWLAYYLPVG